MSLRVRIKSLQGGLNPQRKSLLRERLYENGVKFSRLIQAPDSFICICLSDNDVDLTISTKLIDKLKKIHFDVVIPPPLRAKKSVIIRRLDPDVTDHSEEEIKHDIERRNVWAKIDEIVKLRNIPHMLKIRFKEIAMAKRATTSGLCLLSYHLRDHQIELEQFHQITPCWNCYKYDHLAKDCPDKNIKKCSECAATGHTFRECSNKHQPKCLNCGGDHRTLASACPLRKYLIKKMREEALKRKTDQNKDKTYAAVTKLHTDIPKLVENRQETVLNLNTVGSFQVMVLTIQAHLANMAKPGTFGKTLRELLRLNNLPDVVLPDNAPSFEIFGAINGLSPNQVPQLNMPPNEVDKSNQPLLQMEEEEIDVTIGTQDQNATVLEPSVKPRPNIQPSIPEAATSTDIPPTPINSPQRPQVTHEQAPDNLEVRFISSSDDKIPESLTTSDLLTAIDHGRVKFLYRGPNISEDRELHWIREGHINTTITPIRRVDRTVYKKARNGWQQRDESNKLKVRVFQR